MIIELVLGCPIKRDSNATTYGFIIVQHSAEIGEMTKFWAKNGGANMATETQACVYPKSAGSIWTTSLLWPLQRLALCLL